MPKKVKVRLPNEIIPMPSSDKKGWRERWYEGRNMLNLPHSFRLLCIGPPDSGKSTLIKNIIIRAKPAFERIQLFHFGSQGEYDDIDVEHIDEIDPLAYEDNTEKTLLIIEDCCFRNCDKEMKHNLNRMFGYTSSHCNLSIAITSQNPYDISVDIRRTANTISIWRCADMNALNTLASRCGIKKQNMEWVMINVLKNPHDFLLIDLQANSPAKYRINGFSRIEFRD